jgi:hypothetical protein
MAKPSRRGGKPPSMADAPLTSPGPTRAAARRDARGEREHRREESREREHRREESRERQHRREESRERRWLLLHHFDMLTFGVNYRF